MILVLAALASLPACSTQAELRMAAQQEQLGREAASQGDWGEAMRSYEAALNNAELGHGDAAWQARLHHQAGRAASAVCRYDAAEYHFRDAIALAKKSRQSSALSYKALIDQFERQGKTAQALAVCAMNWAGTRHGRWARSPTWNRCRSANRVAKVVETA